MNGLCGMISVSDDNIGNDSFGDSSYGMPIGGHYYMDDVRSDYGCEFGSDDPEKPDAGTDFGTEGFPEEFLGGPITFGDDFGTETGAEDE